MTAILEQLNYLVVSYVTSLLGCSLQKQNVLINTSID